jgi:hypothetical protein
MRAGTQTLIQALQAIPWNDYPDNEDDVINHSFDTELDSEEDDKPGGFNLSIQSMLNVSPLKLRSAASIVNTHDLPSFGSFAARRYWPILGTQIKALFYPQRRRDRCRRNDNV